MMYKKNYRGRRLLASLMLFTMISSVVADCNVATAFAADNKLNISESKAVLEEKDYEDDNLAESNVVLDQVETPEVLEEENNNVLEEDSHNDSLSKPVTDTNQNEIPENSKDNKNLEDNNQNKIPDNSKDDKNLEGNNNSKEVKEETSNPVPDEKTKENNDFNKELIIDGYKVEIKAAEGVFPDGTKVEIETVDTIGDEDVTDVISEEMEEIESDAEIVKTVTFDINFYSKDGEIIEPENGSVSITITPDLQEVSELQEIENELGTSLECSVLHVDDELNVEEVECEITEDYTEVSFDAESFSTYTVIWYASPDQGKQEISLEGPKNIEGFEKVPFGFTEFNIPITWTNDDGDDALRPSTLDFTVYGTDTTTETGTGKRIKICDVKVTLTDLEKKASNITINLADENKKIPVYVQNGTGEIKSGGDGHYIMTGFKYEVKFHDENIAYTAKYDPATSAYSGVTTYQEDNEAIWYANAKKITNERKELAEPSFKIEWYDNNNENHKRPYSDADETANINAIKDKVKLYYCTEGDSTLKPVTSDMMPAGVASTGPNISKDSYSTWSISYKNLIPKDENGNKIIYKLKIDDNFAGVDYTTDKTPDSSADSNKFIDEGGKRNYYFLGNFEAEIRWNDGGRDNELRPEIADKIKVFKIEEGADGQPVEVPVSISSEDIVINKTGNTENTWNFKIKNLVMYSNEGDGVVSYYVKLDGITLVDTTDHIYGISYTNAPKSTDVSKCHNEGTIYLTLKNDLKNFTIHKEWLDGKDGTIETNERKEFIHKGVTLYLWRYPVKKVIEKASGDKEIVMGTIEDGAPVNDANGKQYTYVLDESTHNKNFDLHLTDFVTGDSKLDMYDTQGYEYVYYVTEIMNGNEYVTSY